ncbi:MAG: hypothetical protein ACRC41_12840 [Sarcina sp.]
MAKRMSVSFKERETFLYEHIQKQLDPLYYIKNLVFQDINSNGTQENIKSEKNETSVPVETDDFEIIFE